MPVSTPSCRHGAPVLPRMLAGTAMGPFRSAGRRTACVLHGRTAACGASPQDGFGSRRMPPRMARPPGILSHTDERFVRCRAGCQVTGSDRLAFLDATVPARVPPATGPCQRGDVMPHFLATCTAVLAV